MRRRFGMKEAMDSRAIEKAVDEESERGAAREADKWQIGEVS